jgi:secondary thiamine-phosphate synthase enzyme
MPVITEYISISTNGKRDVIDITSKMQDIITINKIKSGIAVAFTPGSTGAITTIEFEPGLKKDINQFLERLIPYGENYHHHNTWHDDNGAAHLQAAMIGPSVTVPVIDSALSLGTWQQVVFIDCDTRPRSRRIIIQIVY